MHATRFTLLLLLLPGTAQAQSAAHVARAYSGVGLTPKLGAEIPPDLVFLRSDSTVVPMGTLLERPTLLTFVYHTCPMLCSVLLDGLTQALEAVPWTPGVEFDLVTVSISPDETPSLAAKQRERHLARLGRPEAEWHFLTGEESAIRALAESVGFGYSWVEEQGEYAHPAALIFLSEDGVVTRYLADVAPQGRDVRAALVEASEGSIGSLLDRAFLFCFQYDPTANSYVLAARRTMRLGGIMAAIALMSLLAVLWRRELIRPAA